MTEKIRLQRMEDSVSQHAERLAKLEQISQNLDDNFKELHKSNEKIYTAYMEMQGNLKAIIDIKDDIKEMVKDQDLKIKENSDGIDRLNTKIIKITTVGVTIVSVIEFLGNYPRIIELFS